MTQSERRLYLINELLKERREYADIRVPPDVSGQRNLLRSLLNVRMPKPVSKDFLSVQDMYLKEEIRRKGITELDNLTPSKDGLYLWQGDITTLKCDSIVNAANSGMLGCFYPCHGCIDNAIHTFSGMELRLFCNEIMQKSHCEEPTGSARITPAFNLPCRFIIHTVGPVVSGKLTERDCELLRSCYRSCLKSADDNNLNSIAFCCISTGEFHFPNDIAAKIAVDAVKQYKAQTKSEIKVIFDVFKDTDYEIYRGLLEKHK